MGDFLRTVTPLQWFGVIILFNSVLIGGTTQLAHLFIPEAGVQAIGAFCTLVNGFLGGLVTMFGGQGNMIRSVAAFQGTDGQPALRVAVNANAGQAVAAVAVDPTQPNVGASSADIRSALIRTANAA